MRLFVATNAVPAALLVLLVVVNRTTGIQTSHFTRDAVQVLEAPFYTGMYSQLGILAWCSCASICFFTSARLSAEGKRPQARFLLAAAALTALLMVDDSFVLHDEVFPAIGIPERLVAALYPCLAVLLVWTWRDAIWASDWVPLLAAFAFLAMSAAMDDVMPKGEEFRGYFILEDGAKLLGIANWSAYFISFCWQQLACAKERPEMVHSTIP